VRVPPLADSAVVTALVFATLVAGWVIVLALWFFVFRTRPEGDEPPRAEDAPADSHRPRNPG